MAAGLRDFCREFNGQIWLEILLVGKPAPTPEDVRKLKELVKGLAVDKIQLNTVDRPPAERFAMPLGPDGNAENSARPGQKGGDRCFF